MKKTVTFIVNPFSGTSTKSSIVDLINNRLDRSQYDHKIEFTKYAGHAIELSKLAKEQGVDIIVAVGGDGSVNEVAQSLLGSKSVLGILPGGSGNGLAMHLGLGRDTALAIEHINTGKIVQIDTCKVNNRFFANVAGLGYDAKIAYLTKKNEKRGFLPYFITSVQESKNFEPTPMRIDIDGKIVEGKFAAAVVANASMYGYRFCIAPEASLQDGIMDVILIKDSPIHKYFLSSYRFLNRSVHKSKLIETYKGKSIKITLYNEDFLHVDGEGYISNKELSFEIDPLSLNVMIPSKFEINNNWTL